MWVRVLLVQREFNGYHWVDGVYSKGKSAVLEASVTAGEYYLLIMPEWNPEINYELSLLLWGSHIVRIERMAQTGAIE